MDASALPESIEVPSLHRCLWGPPEEVRPDWSEYQASGMGMAGDAQMSAVTKQFQ